MREQDEAVKRLWSKTKNGLIVPKSYEVDNVERESASQVKSRRINLKAKFKTVIDNLTMIVLLPSLLGAIWQILVLSEIHVAYIRFFSVSQIPVDGALIIFLSTIFYIAYFLCKKFTELALKDKYKSAEQLANNFEEKNYKKFLRKSLIKIVVFLFCIISCIHLFFDKMFPVHPITSIFIVGFLILGGYLEIRTTLTNLVTVSRKLSKFNYLIGKIENFKDTKFYKSGAYVFVLFILVIGIPAIVISTSISLFTYFNNIFLLSGDLKNSERIKQEVLADYKTDKYRIRYMNDKYIFVEICTDAKCDEKVNPQIAIFQTEKTLFKVKD